jgi:hypothetical protein
MSACCHQSSLNVVQADRGLSTYCSVITDSIDLSESHSSAQQPLRSHTVIGSNVNAPTFKLIETKRKELSVDLLLVAIAVALSRMLQVFRLVCGATAD